MTSTLPIDLYPLLKFMEVSLYFLAIGLMLYSGGWMLEALDYFLQVATRWRYRR
jgi:hypothetical protein